MMIIIFYVLMTLYFLGFGMLFGLDFQSFGSIWTYVIGLGNLVLAFILSVGSILVLLKVLGMFRKGKPYTDSFNHKFANSLLRLVLYLCRIKVNVSGLEHMPKDNKFVFVCNHQENIDIPVLMPQFKNHPICFIAKKPLFKAPFIGKWIELLGNVPIGKMADRAAAKSIITGIKRYNEGVPFGIFPEGRRARSNEMVDFKPGAFKLATKPKADLFIGTIYNMGDVFSRIPFRKYQVYVHFHPIMKYEEYKDLNTQQLSEKVKSIIQTKLDEYKESLK